MYYFRAKQDKFVCFIDQEELNSVTIVNYLYLDNILRLTKQTTETQMVFFHPEIV